MASITDVARLAGVSTATVSRVVSASTYAVSPATRARVLEAARALDYVPNALAQGLHKSHVPVVGVIVHDITDPYFAEVVRGVEDAASVGGFLVITCSSDRIAERELLVCPPAPLDAGGDPHLRRQRPRRPGAQRAKWPGTWRPCGPTARRSCTSRRTRPATPRSASTMPPASQRMVAALVELGHRRIAFLAGPASLYVVAPSAWRATAAAWPRPASRTTSGSS